MPTANVEYSTRHYAAFKSDPNSDDYSHVEEVSDRNVAMAIHVANLQDTSFVIYDVTRITLDGMELMSEPYRFTDVHFIDGQVFSLDQVLAILRSSLIFDEHIEKTEVAIDKMKTDNLDAAVLVFEAAEVGVLGDGYNTPHWVPCESATGRIVLRSTELAS